MNFKTNKIIIDILKATNEFEQGALYLSYESNNYLVLFLLIFFSRQLLWIIF